VNLPQSGSNWDGAMAAPTVANIDGDAELEVVIGTAHTGLVAYDLPGSSNARVFWGTGRGTHLRAGTPPGAPPPAPPGGPPPSGAFMLYLPLISRGCD
jgi:hypothetical protein